jgi:hypothetical protein
VTVNEQTRELEPMPSPYTIGQVSAAGWRTGRSWIARDGLAIILFALAAMASMYPVMACFSKRIIGWAGDNIQYVYMTGWVAEALRTGQSILVDPHLNYPQELVLAATDVPYLSMIVAAPAVWLGNPVVAYNVIMFFSSLLSGYFAYLWIHSLTGSRFGGIVAGLLFLFSPYRIAHSYGHLQLVSTQVLPLFFWALDRALQPERPVRRDLFILTGATFLVGFATSQYYLCISLVTGVVYALLTILHKKRYLLCHGWKLVVSVGLGAVLSAWPYLVALHEWVSSPYPIAQIREGSASLLDFLVPSRLHPLWGTLVEQFYPRKNWIEFTLYFGTLAIILALVTLLSKSGPHRQRNRIWFGVALFGLVIALGTDLHWNGQPVQQQNPIWLPAYYLAHLPFVNLLRVWSRFAIIPILFIALLAGVGAALLEARFRQRWLMMLAITALIILELAPGRLQVTTLQPRPVDLWLAQQPGEISAAFLPPGFENYYAMYGSLFHHKRLPAFNHPKHLPAAFLNFFTQATHFPAPQSIRAFQDMELNYLIVHKDSYDGIQLPRWIRVEEMLAHSEEVMVVAEVAPFVILNIKAPR